MLHPNLDCLGADELREVARSFANFAAYANAKLRSIEHRAAGQVATAEHFESLCYGIYTKLPEGMKW